MGLAPHVFILHVCKHACACNIDDVEPIVQITYVWTRCVHNSLQMLTCMSGMYMPNFICVHFDVYPNSKPGIEYKFYKHIGIFPL